MAVEVPKVNFEDLLAIIRQGESGPDGYNAINQGTAGDTPGGSEAMLGKPLTEMTVQEVMDQQKGDAYAVGAYQFIPETLGRLVETYNIDTSQPFSQELQDELAVSFISELPAFKTFISEGGDPAPLMKALSNVFAAVPDAEGNNPLGSVGGNKVTVDVDTFRDAVDSLAAPVGVTANVASAGAADPSISMPEPMNPNQFVERGIDPETGERTVTVVPPTELAKQFFQTRKRKVNEAVSNFLSGGLVAQQQQADAMRDLKLEQIENQRYQNQIKLINDSIERMRTQQSDRRTEVGLTMRKIFGELAAAERQKGREANDKYLAFFEALVGGGGGGLKRMDQSEARGAIDDVLKAHEAGENPQTIIRELAVKYDMDSVVSVVKQAQEANPRVLEVAGEVLDGIAAVEGETLEGGYPENVIYEYVRGIYGQLPGVTNNVGAAFQQIMMANPGQALMQSEQLAEAFERRAGVDKETASKLISLYGGLASGLAARDLGTAMEMAQMMYGITEEKVASEAEYLNHLELRKLALINAMSSRPDAPEFADLQQQILSSPHFINMPGTPAQKLKAAAILGRRALRDQRKQGRQALKEIRQVGSAQPMLPGALEHLVKVGAITQDEADRAELESRMGDLTVRRAGGGVQGGPVLSDAEVDLLPDTGMEDVVKANLENMRAIDVPADQAEQEAKEVIEGPIPAARGVDIPRPDAYKPRAPLTERDKALASTRKSASAIDSGAVSLQDILRRDMLKQLNEGKQDGAAQ